MHVCASCEVCAQFLWENSTRVLVDFTPGAGGMVKAALMMAIKIILVCHNAAQVRVLRDILRAFVLEDMKQSSSRFAPVDKKERLEACKPDRLKKHETQKKRGNDDMQLESPAAKRTALGECVENMLADLDSPSAQKSPAVAKAKAAAAAAAAAKAAAAAATTGASGNGSTSGGQQQIAAAAEGAAGAQASTAYFASAGTAGAQAVGSAGTAGAQASGSAGTGAKPKAAAPPVAGPAEDLQALLAQWAP